MTNNDIKEKFAKILSEAKGLSIEDSRNKLSKYFEFIDSMVIFEGWRHPGTHIHHIIPRALFKNSENKDFLNSWDSGNLIRLTPENHQKAHEILYECTKLGNMAGASKMVHGDRWGAFMALSHSEESTAKRKKTMLEKYGNTEGPCHWSESRKKASPKAVKTIEERFGSFQNCLRSPEVNARLAKEHGGDPYWHIHSPQSYENLSKSQGTPIYKVSLEGDIIKEYWAVRKAMKDEGFSSRMKIAVNCKLVYKGFYWIKVSEYEEWHKSKFSSTTISEESTQKSVETSDSDESQK